MKIENRTIYYTPVPKSRLSEVIKDVTINSERFLDRFINNSPAQSVKNEYDYSAPIQEVNQVSTWRKFSRWCGSQGTIHIGRANYTFAKGLALSSACFFGAVCCILYLI